MQTATCPCSRYLWPKEPPPWQNPLLHLSPGSYGEWKLDVRDIIPHLFEPGCPMGHNVERFWLGGHELNRLVGDTRINGPNSTFFRDHVMLQWLIQERGSTVLPPHMTRSLRQRWQALGRDERRILARNEHAAVLNTPDGRASVRRGVLLAATEVEAVGRFLCPEVLRKRRKGRTDHALEYVLRTLHPFFEGCDPATWTPNEYHDGLLDRLYEGQRLRDEFARLSKRLLGD